MAFSMALLLLLLLVAVPSTTAEVLKGRGREVHAEPADEAGYKTYIIMLKPRHDIMEDDADARREWHQSFLPSTTTSLGQPRLLCSYRAVFDGFSARLTEEELGGGRRQAGLRPLLPQHHLLPAGQLIIGSWACRRLGLPDGGRH